MNEPDAPRLGRGMFKRFLLGAVLIVAMTATATATAALLTVKGIADAFKDGAPTLDLGGEAAPAAAGRPQTLLLLGSDRRFKGADVTTGFAGRPRSDTMIVMRLDPRQGLVSLMSIPRDLKVDIPQRDGTYKVDKINGAYEAGGPRLALRVVKQLLGIPINHVVDVNFRSFRQAVDQLGCIYADVDRKYFNRNLGTPETNFAEIDVPAGYQKLCGQDALDYVRFRHNDSDLVRAARQQDFVRQAKQQVGVSRLIGDRTQLLRIFARNARSDLSGDSRQILRLIETGLATVGRPVQEVTFPARISDDPKDTFVRYSETRLRAAVRRFLGGVPSSGPRPGASPARRPRSSGRRRSAGALPRGLIRAPAPASAIAGQLAGDPRMPIVYPTVATSSASYSDDSRRYRLRDESGRVRRGYRIVVRTGEPGQGQYYGIQGTDWPDPPILANPSARQRVGGRELLLYRDGTRLRLVAFKTPRATYWVSNDLLKTLDNRQMIAIAASLRRAG